MSCIRMGADRWQCNKYDRDVLQHRFRADCGNTGIGSEQMCASTCCVQIYGGLGYERCAPVPVQQTCCTSIGADVR